MAAKATIPLSRTATTTVASMRGATRRSSGLMPMTSMAEISSRMVRAPSSEQMADPPAPASRRAVTMGEASRTVPMASTAPTNDAAPI